MIDDLFLDDLAENLAPRLDTQENTGGAQGSVTVSNQQAQQPEQVKMQQDMGTITPIPQTTFEKALESSGIKLSELGDIIDQNAPGTLNTLTGSQIPVIGNMKLRDFLPFVGSMYEGKLTGTPAALIAAGTGQPLSGQPVVSSTVGPDGQTYYGTSGSPAMLNEDVGTAMVDVATFGVARPAANLAKKISNKAVKATKGLPVGMSTQAVQGMDELGFYSAAKQAVDAIQQPKGTGEQFLAQITNTPGVKPDEIKWTGLDDFLKSKKSVTKAEVQEYLDKNRVEIKEVKLGEQESYDPARLKQLENEYANLKEHPIDDPSFGEDKYDELIKLMNIRDRSTTDSLYASNESATRAAQRAQAKGMKDAAEKYFREAELFNTRAEKLDLNDLGMKNPTKYGKYQLPGGENYREVLLTLPSKQTGQSQIAFKTTEDADNFLTDMSISGFEDMNYGRLNDTNIVEFDGAIPSNVTQMIRNNDGDIIAGKDMAGSTYGSPHFEQPNILAHLRVNDRIDADGKKVLFVEEVQSDWHQAGRKQGYKDPAIKDEYQALEKELMAVNREAMPYTSKGEDAPQALIEKKIALSERMDALDKKYRQAVPDAPFKTTWSELAMKRAIQMASEGGYERIAFTTGKTQAERFDLSKQINDITIARNKTNFVITATNKDGLVAINQSIPDLRNLDEIVGKDLAEKVKDDFANKSGNEHNYAGLDLQVGGEGMKGFYDDILPKFLNKYAKKWDAKAGMTEIATKPTRGAGGMPSMYPEKVPVHYIDITPKMRESTLTKGQPMFAIGAGGAGAATMQEDNK
jgi:hypothetical protein